MVTSPADREAKLAALHERLANQVRELRTGEDWTRWLAVASRFHDYSFNNTLLILAQRPDATAVAGYKAWQSLGRHVDKGEKGLQILAPILRRREEPEEDTERAGDAVRVAGYRVTHVWDIKQTSGDPLPEQPAPTPLRGEAPEGLWSSLAGFAEARGFRLQRASCGGANGLTHFGDRTITVRLDVDDAQAVKTLAHELGHVVLHGPADNQSVVPCRGVVEVEAESVAYLVSATHGLDTGSYTFPYVVGWAGSVQDRTAEQVVRDVGQRVLQTANALLDQLVPTSGDQVAREIHRLVDSSVNRPVMAPATALPDTRKPFSPRTTELVDSAALFAAVDDAAAFYVRQSESSWVPDYLSARGLAAVLGGSTPWHVGYAPKSWTALTEHLRGAGFSDATLLQAGLSLEARTGHLVDRFRDRLMLPVRDEVGRVVAFVGRCRPGAGELTPKYINSPTTPIYRKGELLLSAHSTERAGASTATPVVVEGPLDAMAVWVSTADRHTAAALCGTAMSVRQAGMLSDLAGGLGRPVVVATDADPAGRKAAETAYWRLTEQGLTPWAADLPPGIDAAELLEQHGPARLAASLTCSARPLIDDIVDQRVAAHSGGLRWVEQRVGAVREIAPFVAALPPSQWARPIGRLVDLVGIEAATAFREVLAAKSAVGTRPATGGPCTDAARPDAIHMHPRSPMAVSSGRGR